MALVLYNVGKRYYVHRGRTRGAGVARYDGSNSWCWGCNMGKALLWCNVELVVMYDVGKDVMV